MASNEPPVIENLLPCPSAGDEVVLNSKSLGWNKVLASDSTNDSALADLADVAIGSAPEVIPVRGLTWVWFAPYGADAEDDEFDMQLWDVRLAGSVLVRRLLAEVDCTLGTRTGIAGGIVTASDRYADGIVKTSDFTPNSSMLIPAVTANTIGVFGFDAAGSIALQAVFSTNGKGQKADTMNAMWYGY